MAKLERLGWFVSWALAVSALGSCSTRHSELATTGGEGSVSATGSHASPGAPRDGGGFGDGGKMRTDGGPKPGDGGRAITDSGRGMPTAGSTAAAASASSEHADAQSPAPSGSVSAASTTGCFEPCGGDPTGNWILETGCLRGSGVAEGCQGGSLEGKVNNPTLRLSFTADSLLRVTGTDSWTLSAQAPRSCLGLTDAEPCTQGLFFTSPLLFVDSRFVVTCQGQAGVQCACSNAAEDVALTHYTWAAEDAQLSLNGSLGAVFATTPYCVQDDVLWLGGHDSDGQTFAAYKFRKHSCTPTEPPCDERTSDECQTTVDCQLGACIPAPGTTAFCESAGRDYCEENPDCTWIPNKCASSGVEQCEFHHCEEQDGCALGPAVARCTGVEWCGGSDVSKCDVPGCSVAACAPRFAIDAVDCEGIDPEDCELSPGCSFDGTLCTGLTHCTAQTDPDVCALLNCLPQPYCAGRPTRSCASLSPGECSTQPGCQVTW